MKNVSIISYTQDISGTVDCITEGKHWHTYPYHRPLITSKGAERILKREGVDYRNVIAIQHAVRE